MHTYTMYNAVLFSKLFRIMCRAFLDYSREGSAVISERVLLQPFHMLLAVERNLCPWYISIPILSVNCTMGELQV